MAKLAGTATFVISLFMSYQIFPDPGTGSSSYLNGRIVFVLFTTIVVAVIANKSEEKRLEQQERYLEEQERYLEEQERQQAEVAQQRRIALIREREKREDSRRSTALADARSRVDHLREIQQRRDTGHRQERYDFGVVADKYLASLVRSKLGTWSAQDGHIITVEQMASLTGALHIDTRWNQTDAMSLEGLQYATNMEELRLHLRYENVDLTPIAALSNLRKLEIFGGTGISSIDAIATLDGLEYLALDRLSNISDFRPLAGLERLTQLKLTSLSDTLEFDSISGLQALTKLEINKMSWLSDLQGISNLHKLEELVVCSVGSQIELSRLSKLSRLKSLCLYEMQIDYFDGIGSLPTLKALKLRKVAGVDNLRSLSKLVNLTQLELVDIRRGSDPYPGNRLHLTPLVDLHQLRKLTLSPGIYGRFEDWDAISRVRGLVELEVTTEWSSSNELAAFSDLINLRVLRISYLHIPDLEPLLALSQLERLEVKGGGFESPLIGLELLSDLPRLRTLVVSSCEGLDLLRDIGQFRRLTHLELRYSQLAHTITNLSALKNLDQLETLILKGNSNVDLDPSPLNHLKGLKMIELT